MKILLLDDEASILSAVKRALGRMGHEVEQTTDAAKAVVMIEQGNFDFALVDYMMPVHDGIWFMKHARIPRKTKVLLMTAFVNRQVINEMFKLGARGYLIKPIESEELAQHLAFHSTSRPAAPV